MMYIGGGKIILNENFPLNISRVLRTIFPSPIVIDCLIIELTHNPFNGKYFNIHTREKKVERHKIMKIHCGIIENATALKILLNASIYICQ